MEQDLRQPSAYKYVPTTTGSPEYMPIYQNGIYTKEQMYEAFKAGVASVRREIERV
jgi:hypothetical protein